MDYLKAADTVFDSVYETPVLIIGAGAAGARTAIGLQQEGIESLVVGKRDYGDAHTVWAAGGVNASLGSRDPEDDWKIHAADTLVEGHLINDPTGVEAVTKTMPERIRELDEWGMEFARTEQGEIDQRYFGAQSFRRTCYVGDRTGEAMLNTLVRKAQSLNIPYQENVMITQLVSDSEEVYGAVGFDMETGESLYFDADYVVLAAGGYSSVYSRHSSRDDENNGDAAALAIDAGAELLDMEFVQFHPTGMIRPGDGDDWSGRLVTEAVRGEGGRLYNVNGERFMKRYSPEQMELDARDVVARAIAKEIEEGRGTENGGVYLDISHRERDFIKRQLPRMYARFEELGVDLSEEAVEVAPTAHYTMGGVDIDFDSGETAVRRLYAVGEATGGVHGANRLGGNSLAETVAIGAIVAQHISQTYAPQSTAPSNTSLEKYRLRITERKQSKGTYTPQELMSQITATMTKYGGIVRTEEQLRKGLAQLEQIGRNSVENQRIDPEQSRSTEYSFNVDFMLTTAKCVLTGALLRKESRGAHYREDFTETDRAHKVNIVYKKNANGEIETVTRDVPEPSEEIQQTIDEDHHLEYHFLE